MTTAAEIERVPTSDGACVTLKRRSLPGGTPIVFLHGLAANADLWNLPDIQGQGFVYRSLAALLHERGFDIWLMNLRGHGAPAMRSDPAPGQTDWCVDHFILYDLPAVIDHVCHVTGRHPFAVGASMGSMTLAGYVQGARLVGVGAEAHIVADRETACARQARLAGCVFAEFPAALRWPAPLYDAAGTLDWRMLLREAWRGDERVNYPFELLAHWGWLEALVTAAGEVPLNWLAGELADTPWYRRLPKPLAEGLERAEHAVVQALLNLAGTFTGATNHRAEVLLRGRRYMLDSMKAGVLAQMAKCVRARSFVSALGTPDHLYTDHYHLVELPVLVVQGGRDRIANAEITQTAFFDRIASADKELLLDPDIAHGEIEAAPVACARLYPRIIAWLKARCAA